MPTRKKYAPIHRRTHTHTHTLSLTLCLSLFLSFSLSHSLSVSISFFLSLSLSLSLFPRDRVLTRLHFLQGRLLYRVSNKRWRLRDVELEGDTMRCYPIIASEGQTRDQVRTLMCLSVLSNGPEQFFE